MKTTSIPLVLSALFLGTMTACTGAELDKTATSANRAENYKLIRDWKRVTRYNCAGEITSDQVETVRSPNKFVTIRPRNVHGLYQARFTNLTNNSNAGMISGNDSFTIDMAPTLLNMKVEEGLNLIQYDFSYCDEFKKSEAPNQPTGECKHSPEIRESGSLYVRVEYIQNWLDGQDIVKPTEEECKQLEEKAKRETQAP